MIGWFGDGNGYVGNLDLKPERADTLGASIALGGAAAGWSAKISPYYTRVHDYIDARFLREFTDMMGMPTGFVQLQFSNEEAEFYGVDVSGDVTLWQGKGRDRTTLAAVLGWQRGGNPETGEPLYHQMPFSLKLGLSHAQGPLELGADFRFVADKSRVDPLRREPRTDGYALFDLRAAWRVAGVRLSVEALNLFDKAYFLPLGGQSLGDYAATGALRPVAGQGRSFNLGISTSF